MSAWDRDGSAVPRTDQRRSGAPGALSPHTRLRFWQTVRVRILLPVVIATAAVLVLGTIQFGQALGQAGEADRSSRLARASIDVATLAYHIAQEYVVHNQARRAGGAEQGPVLEQERRTDDALERFKAAHQVIRTTAPQLSPVSDAAERAVAGLASARAIIREAPDGSAEVRAFYDQMLRAVLSLTDALPAQLSDQRLIELSRAFALFGRAAPPGLAAAGPGRPGARPTAVRPGGPDPAGGVGRRRTQAG